MPDLAVNPRRVAPMVGAKVRNMIASSAGNIGDVVVVNPDFGAGPANAAAPATAAGIGVVSAVNCEGATAFVPGDAISVVTYGAVSGYKSTAPGTLFVSNNPGKVSDAPGTTSRILGRIENAELIFINPVLV